MAVTSSPTHYYPLDVFFKGDENHLKKEKCTVNFTYDLKKKLYQPGLQHVKIKIKCLRLKYMKI